MEGFDPFPAKNGRTAGLSLLLCLGLCVLASMRFSRQLFEPIRALNSAMREVEEGNLNVQLDNRRIDEMGQLSGRFNRMAQRLRQNLKDSLRQQRELNEAQIRMMQAQLNPHFLCNTLDTMKWISKIKQVPQVALMSTDLADILRFCISPDEFVPLRREVEILRRYMEIQSIRLSGKCRLEVDMPPELEECRVPKMILQPLAENAILHGLDGVEDGVIWVRVRSQGTQTLTISVEDNGRGLPPELMGPYTGPPETSGRGHLGLYNVDTILKKHYGEAYGLRLGSRPGGPGAAVTASLPLWKEEEIC